MRRYHIFFYVLLLAAVSCFKRQPDAPPDKSAYDPALHVTATIAKLKDMPLGIPLPDSVIIAGVVIMDDRNGNYFKQIVMQDATGGIAIAIDQNNLYADYPVGRKIYVQCGGLFLGQDKGMYVLGYAPDATGRLSGIPFAVADRFLVKADYPHLLIPDTVTIADLTDSAMAWQRLNTLVVLREIEFADSSTGIPYALPPDMASGTLRMLADCNGGSLALRTSGYATFRTGLTPAGRGSITALFTRFGSNPQLYIRDTADVRFYDERCDAVPPAGSLITINKLRHFFHGAATVLPDYRIRGIVISDYAHGNVTPGRLIFQGGDGDNGIVLAYSGMHNYALGDSLELNTNHCRLDMNNSKLALSGIPESAVTLLGTGRTVHPSVTTVARIRTNRERYESTLVTISGVYWDSSAMTYNGVSGNLGLSDATGTIKHYCTMQATFKDNPLPTGPVTVTGYVDVFNGTPQLRIRNPEPPENDVRP